MELPLEENTELVKEEENTADETAEHIEVTTDCAVADQVEDATEEQQSPHTVEEQPEVPQTVHQKQDNPLNLNNEVVKMRKEVKRVRALIIRKLTRQMGVLKKKKGKDADIERNQRRAARLLEEIHAIKTLVPDKVTKTALQKNLNFEQVCKDPKSSISDRAIARIATHPQFSKKIDSIKAAVKAFKEEHSKEEKPSGKMQKKADKTKKQLPHNDTKKESNEAGDKTVRSLTIKLCETDFVEASLDSPAIRFPKVKSEQNVKEKETPHIDNKNKKLNPVKHVERSKLQNKSVGKKIASKLSEVQRKSDMETESDLEFSDGDEKEYFDDSTEERFHKQSSAESEESDNDFFVGKVTKFKKKKTKTSMEDKVKKTLHENSNNPLQTDKVQSELDELESRLKSKVTSLNSVFCSSLARTKTGKGAGKHDRKFGGPYKREYGGSDGTIGFSKRSKFHEQPIGKQKDSDSKYNKLGDKTYGKEHKNVGGRGHAKEYVRQKETRGRSTFSHQAPAQPLHPSWEASKKRKEQQGQILAFQGKKITFDDDE